MMRRRVLEVGDVARRMIRTQARFNPQDVSSSTLNIPTPRQLMAYLDEYVVGQSTAKKVLSVAVFNHYNRVRANLAMWQAERQATAWPEETQDQCWLNGPFPQKPHPTPPSLYSARRDRDVNIDKSNVLVIGPTGSGKTLLIKTLARILDVPFSVSDATSFTQAGYVGDDVDMCIQRLLQAAQWDGQRASTGIVYIDECDKLARKVGSGGLEGTRDVGGEGVQQALLRMMEGSTVSVQGKGDMDIIEGRLGRGGRGGFGSAGAKETTYQINTGNVLFILSGAFVGLESIIRKRVSKGSIGFTAPLASSSADDSSSIPFFTSNRKDRPSLSEHTEPSDLVNFGFIPEFISRLPIVTTLSPLTRDDLFRILTSVRGSLVSQYTELFGCSGAELRFTTRALRSIAQIAAERGGGARGLRGIMEKLLLDSMFTVPGSNFRYVLVSEAVVRKQAAPLHFSRDEAAEFWSTWATEEET